MVGKEAEGSPIWSVKLPEQIGRVAMASAEADQVLTRVLDDLSRLDDHTWILFRGQSTDWLIKSIVQVIKFGAMLYRSTPQDMAKIKDLVEEIGRLHERRNTVIHGVWSEYPSWSEIDDEDPDWRPRPRFWGNRDSDTILYCHRTRLRKIPPDQEMTISDVQHLADLIENASDGLLALLSEIKGRKSEAHPPLQAIDDQGVGGAH